MEETMCIIYRTLDMLKSLDPRIGSLSHIERKNRVMIWTELLQTVRQRTDAHLSLCTNGTMHSQNHEPLTAPETLTPEHTVPQQVQAPAWNKDSVERHDDPAQAEELERQQDA
jgi:hypothetical protein